MLTFICFGVGLATLNDVSFSGFGVLCGIVQSFMGGTHALLGKHVQSKYHVIGNDLLRTVLPYTALLQSSMVLLTDDVTKFPQWLDHTPKWPWAFGLLLLSCLGVWALEWSSVMVVHVTSAMTMQVCPRVHCYGTRSPVCTTELYVHI